jgi:hypothetical protein
MDFTSDIGMTVAEWVASASGNGGFEFDDQIRSYRDRRIVRMFDGREHAFPQRVWRYRNVMVWALLDDGTAVGFNESPRSGYSFPRSGKKIVGQRLAQFERTSSNPSRTLFDA